MRAIQARGCSSFRLTEFVPFLPYRGCCIARKTKLSCLSKATSVDLVHGVGRREALLLALFAVPGSLAVQPSIAENVAPLQNLESAALQAYADRDFKSAVSYINGIIRQDGSNPRWYEMRAQALVDGKSFDLAIKDFDTCIQLLPPGSDLARVHVGRALALEGLGDWSGALQDYNVALSMATDSGLLADPYVLNSRGNCYNSLGRWEEARNDYMKSAELFQEARGFRGRNGSTTQRLDGAIYASSNAALMLAEIGDEDGAVKEMTRIARRAPGSVDMHAALAAIYWSRGQQQQAESEWEYACDQVTVGCKKYQDEDWLRSIRRWPPTMVAKMQQFLHLQKLAVA